MVLILCLCLEVGFFLVMDELRKCSNSSSSNKLRFDFKLLRKSWLKEAITDLQQSMIHEYTCFGKCY